MRTISNESSRGYSHLTSGTSKGSFTPLLQLKKFPGITVSTREEARKFRPHPEEPRFSLLAREEGSFPCVLGKEFPAFPSHLKRRRSQPERREELLGRATIPRSRRCLVHSRETCFPCTASTFKPRIDSHQGGTWDRPVGKPRGKATDPLNHAKGSATLLLQIGRKAHVHPPLETRTDSPGETPEVPQDQCQHWRGIFRFRHRLHTRS